MAETYRGRITIDGKGMFDYVLTPVSEGNGSISIPSAQIPPQRRADGAETITVMLLAHEMKAGVGKNGKPYEKHSFRASDNRKYTTFRNEIVSQLSPMVGAETPVKLSVRANEFKGFDIVGVIGS